MEELEITQDDGDFFVGFGEGVGNPQVGEDDDGAVEGGSQPRDVGVPEEGASLAHDGEVVHVAVAGLNRALGHISRSIGPTTSQLPNAMPVFSNIIVQRWVN